jgi:hypothetical protein
MLAITNTLTVFAADKKNKGFKKLSKKIQKERDTDVEKIKEKVSDIFRDVSHKVHKTKNIAKGGLSPNFSANRAQTTLYWTSLISCCVFIIERFIDPLDFWRPFTAVFILLTVPGISVVFMNMSPTSTDSMICC